jgi:hypothetical protein
MFVFAESLEAELSDAQAALFLEYIDTAFNLAANNVADCRVSNPCLHSAESGLF